MKLKNIFVIILLFIFTINTSSATFFKASKPLKNQNIKEETNINYWKLTENEQIAAGIKIKLWDNEKIIKKEEITQEKLIIEISESLLKKIPKSYKYIKLNIRGVVPNSKIYTSLQKLIYLDLFPNKNFFFDKEKKLNSDEADKIRNAIIWKQITRDVKKIENLEKNKIILDWTPEELDIKLKHTSKEVKEKQEIFQDVYDTLLESHYDKNSLEKTKLLDSAIKWLTKWTGDKFTTYFPPVESKDFMESLNWKFEWIGSYVEMIEPWVLKIISPISGSPSEKAGLKWWDIITEVDWKKITSKISLQEAISWIKGPKNTPVVLTILRKKKTLKITVIRDTIIIKNVEYKKLDYKTFYIKLVTFWDNISWEFTESLKALKKEKNIKKVIIDLRNNPGGLLNQVSDMLWHFVPEFEKTVVVKHLTWTQNYYSKGYNLIDFSKYRIIILQNGGSASASEIFTWTVKDYFPKTTIIGEQSYWKGSVQNIKSYKDGSSLKYTVAKWFTGKTQTGIDWVGIPVDIKLEFDFEKFKKTKIDNQLEKAKSIK